MPVTNTDVGICNEALALLGSKTITALSDDSDKARSCSLLYASTLVQLLGQRTWRFTMRKVQLAQVVTDPINEWTYSYQLPTAMMGGPKQVFNSVSAGVKPTMNFQIYEDKLFSDDEVVVIDYQIEPTPSKFPVTFRSLLVTALASALAPSITEQPDLAEFYDVKAFGYPQDQRRGGLFAVAAQADAASKPSENFEDSEIVAARFS
jgi:hypothetical protein